MDIQQPTTLAESRKAPTTVGSGTLLGITVGFLIIAGVVNCCGLESSQIASNKITKLAPVMASEDVIIHASVTHLEKSEDNSYEHNSLQNLEYPLNPILQFVARSALFALAIFCVGWSLHWDRRKVWHFFLAFLTGCALFGWWFLIVTDGMYIITHN